MSRLTIVEGNSNDKDNVRAIMVKGEKGDKGDNGEITYSDVVDNLTTTSTQLPLSANQGKVLKDLIDEKVTTEELNNVTDEVEKAKLSDVLVCNIAYRDCTEFIDGITDETNPIDGYIQGMTTTENTFIIAMQTGGNYEDKSNMIYLKEISKSTGETLRTAYLELFHANSLAYNETDKEIYVAANSYRDSNYDLAYTNNIIVVDYETFTIKQTITPPQEITLNNRVRSVSYDNKNGVLALADTTDVWIMSDWATVEKHITLDTDFTAPFTNPQFNEITNQNTVVYNNKIYSTRFFENGIVIFDVEGKIIKNCYSFDADIPLQIGELQSIAIEENGDVYIASVQLTVSNNNTCKLYDITIFKTNLIYNGYKNYHYSSILNNRITFYVDCDTTNHIQSGTSITPFKSIQQAIFAAEYAFKSVGCNITLVGSNKQYGFIVTKSGTSLIINGNNNLIYAMQIQSQTIEINNLIVNSDTLINVASATYQSNIMITNQSNVVFNNVIIRNNGNKLDYGMYVTFSTLKIYNTTITNFTNAFLLFNYSTLYMGQTSVSSCDYYWYNTSNCSIYHLDSPAVIERQNPNSNILAYTSKYQRIPFTFENNTLTFTNTDYDVNRFFVFGLRITLDDSSVHVFNTMVRSRSNNLGSLNVIRSGNLYNISVEFNHTATGTWSVLAKATKTVVSSGTMSDITSNITYNLRDVIVV